MKLQGCDFSTATLIDVAFIAIDSRNCVPPVDDDAISIPEYSARCRTARATLGRMPGEDAGAAEATLGFEGDDADLLAVDAVGLFNLHSYPVGRLEAISTAFDLAHG